MHLNTLQTSIYSASIAIKYIKHLRGTIILHAPVKDFRNNNLAIFNALYKQANQKQKNEARNYKLIHVTERLMSLRLKKHLKGGSRGGEIEQFRL